MFGRFQIKELVALLPGYRLTDLTELRSTDKKSTNLQLIPDAFHTTRQLKNKDLSESYMLYDYGLAGCYTGVLSVMTITF